MGFTSMASINRQNEQNSDFKKNYHIETEYPSKKVNDIPKDSDLFKKSKPILTPSKSSYSRTPEPSPKRPSSIIVN